MFFFQMGGNDMANFPSTYPSFSRSNGNHGNRGDGYSNRDGGYRRGNHGNSSMAPPPPAVDPDVLPLPIIKKEALEQFNKEIQLSSDEWANSASEIDFK